MNKHSMAIIMAILFCTACFSQTSYENGYYINNSGQKIECLIKNLDWKNNPDEIQYKISETEEEKKATMASIQEFGIYGHSKYVRKEVQIDRSSINLEKISVQRNPVFQKEQLFLNVLLEGKASLYSYFSGNLHRFFFSTENGPVEQLVYVKYRKGDNSVGENKQFKKQIQEKLVCPAISVNMIRRLEYKRNELVDLFSIYNQCSGGTFLNFAQNKERASVHLYLRPRINQASLYLKNDQTYNKNTDFGNRTSFGMGLDIEITLPFNNNKWAITLEPTYQSFVAKKTGIYPTVISPEVLTASIDYYSLEIPLGLRHYFFLSQSFQVFINGAFVPDFTSGSKIEFKSEDSSQTTSLNVKSTSNILLGLGLKFKNKIGIEFRYFTNRELLSSYDNYSAEYKAFSVVCGYTLF